MEYIQHPTIEVIFIGDKISRNSRITVGGEAISRIKSIKADLCFLGINAIDTVHGVTDNDWDVVQVKKAMIESSETVVAMAISEKINTVQKITVCEVTKIDVLLTELNADDNLLNPYKQKGIQLL